MPDTNWKRLWDNAQAARSAGDWTECVRTLRSIAKRSSNPGERRSAREHIQIVSSIRNAYRHHPGPNLEYQDPNRLEEYADDTEDPWNLIEDWQVDHESSKWETWIAACETWPFIADTENFAGRNEWAEMMADRRLAGRD